MESFRDHVAWLVAEHERLQQTIEDLTVKNSSLHDRLKLWEQEFASEDLSPRPPDEHKKESSRQGEAQDDSRFKGDWEADESEGKKLLVGDWDVSEQSLVIQCTSHGSNVHCQASLGIKSGPSGPDFMGLHSSAGIISVHESVATSSFNEHPPNVELEWITEPMIDKTRSERPWPLIAPRNSSLNGSMICGESVIDSRSWFQTFIMRPNSLTRCTWDVISMLVLSYDIFAIPLEVFEFEPNRFTVSIETGSTIFWSMDLLVTFMTGFHRDGVVEMRPKMIARRYLRGPFAIDLSVVVLDWILAIFTLQVRAVIRVGKTTRAFRLMRAMRAMRLLRTFKMARMLQLLFQYLKSDLTRTLISVMLMVIVLVVFNHYFACGWYAIGTLTNEGWLQSSVLLQECNMAYCYTTALHWSLTQFTPASMEVFPTNLWERIYSICVLVFAMVTFSSFVSSITGAMVYLRKLKTEPAQQEAILRQFFQESKISAELSQRIWMFLRNNHFQHRKRIHLDSLPILKLVPASLRKSLNEELYLPVISWNPLMRRLEKVYPSLIGELCHHAIQEEALTTQEDLFLEYKKAEKMYFISSGTMDYRHHHAGLCTSISEGDWACEPALWLQWSHCGRLTARTSCEIVLLNVAVFREIASKKELAHAYLCTYARLFRDYMSREDTLWYTDIWADVPSLEEVLNECEEAHPSVGTSMARRLSVVAQEISNASRSPSVHHFMSKRLCGLFGLLRKPRKREQDEAELGGTAL